MNTEIKLPEKVSHILKTLHNAGYEAYAVGGCVRDSLMGRTPDDWDITTSAKPEETKRLFDRTIDTGIEHGTVTVMMDHEGFEVTTYRIDGEYTDSRHPKEVSFTSNLIEDLKRRDFTINAMAYNETDGLVDEFDGIGDLREKKICCVGIAEERFGEDALRMMRAVRFAAQLGFEIEEQTSDAIRKLAPSLRAISAERIHTELVKLLVSQNPQMICTAAQLGIIKTVMPELDEVLPDFSIMETEEREKTEKELEALKLYPNEKSIRLAAVLQILGKNGQESAVKAKNILRRLKFDNDTIQKTTHLIRFHDLVIEPDKAEIRKIIYRTGEDLFPMLLQFRRVNQEVAKYRTSDYSEEKIIECQRIEQLYEEIVKDGDCLSLKTLAVTGKDLILAGMKPGKDLGICLEKMLLDVLEHPDHNTREYLLYSVQR
ncbi:MAG: CCA tRNA nucleotidyltransferase [Eubacteriales bacterium]|nr:CCA tRNA nucleotidyltransferase [Eubacteriales bacterium]